MKSYGEYLALLGEDHPDQIAERDSAQLAGALLDGGVPDIELGALIATLRLSANPAVLLDGLVAALRDRANRWRCGPARLMPVAIGCYDGAWDVPNLTPLLGLLLARFHIPVIMHGPLHAPAGVSSAIVLRSLGIMPCAHSRQVECELENRGIAFVPDALIAPGLTSLLSLCSRLGPTALFTTAARLVDPFEDAALVTAWAGDLRELDLMRGVVATHGTRALLMHSSQGQASNRTSRRPRIEYWHEGECDPLFEEDVCSTRQSTLLPDPGSAEVIAAWTQQACDGVRAIPVALLSQVAACLYATGYCDDVNQAKAMAAIGAVHRSVA